MCGAHHLITGELHNFFNMIRASLFFVPDTAATGNCNCGAHHLTTAEVINFFKMIRGIYCIYEISLNFFFLKKKKHNHDFCCCLFLDTAATSNCNCVAHSASSRGAQLRHCISSIGYWDCGAQLSTSF